ncbi:virion structural protein [Xanthomonas phage RTH11]|nr:virion structural protein [Xanthomonas phage RTH11]
MSDFYDKLIEQVDWMARGSGLGNLSEAMINALVGFNHRGVGNPVPYNQDNQGLTFFTRPRLNLSYNNLAADRRLSILGAGKGNKRGHYPSAIRQWLDPDLSKALYAAGDFTHMVDPNTPFIAMLSNNLLSLSGWPDPIAEYYNSDEGMAKETWGMVDGIDTIYSAFDLQANFRNIAGDPISLLFQVWLIYMSLVYQGRMLPYPDSEMLREIDYQTRIYRLILDPTRTYVQKIAACGAAFPTSSALGQAFDFSSDTPFEQGRANQISIPFRCFGAMYQDPILMREFNDVGEMFNPCMHPLYREKYMTRIPREILETYNYGGYPRINMDTNELEWWDFNEAYQKRMAENASAQSSLSAAVATAVPTA